MTEPEGVTAETVVTEDVKVENTEETKAEEIVDDKSAPEAESEGTENEEAEAEVEAETVEAKVERLERENASKQKAIDRKTAAYHAERERFEQKIQELSSLQEKAQSENTLKEPNIEDFDEYSEFEKAKEDYITAKVERDVKDKLLSEQKQLAQQALIQQNAEKRQAQEAEYIKENPHYSKSVNEVQSYLETLTASPEVVKAVEEVVFDGNIPELFDYFGSNMGENLDELGRISKLTPAKAAVEIYKIQQKLSVKTPVKKVSKPAPAPTPRLKGTSAPKDLAKGDVLVNLGLKQA